MKTVGSLFSGVGGLDLAVEEAFNARTIWQCESDKQASKVLAKRFGVPNLGDITAVDWSNVRRPDILCGGFPCQDVSAAGLKKGIAAGTRSGLWSYFADAIDALRPEFVVIENVRGLLNAKANEGERGSAFRRVLSDLAEVGYDAVWKVVRASDVGAPHRRERVFILAHPA
ncbi:DNA methyltransferase [Mycobacterium phage Phlei]|uniref:DNA (cytosine-5-)-methyltransferase n=1 Tax=Mycobacterium phage Phlei TaxID=1690684 RepID=A0A0N9BDN9_9CAUD|nr:DNA methyltransferase [Mycobacterium phage Phlei]ALA48177.1 hypothetical protein [Mycobacterium phage Phlei]